MKKVISGWRDVLPLRPGGEFPEYPTLSSINLTPLGHPFRDLRYWSNLVIGEGDETLADDKSKSYPGAIGWMKKELFWKKLIVLQVIGDSYGEFVVGFYSKRFGLCKVSDQRRTTLLYEGGPFTMRVGPDDCGFFIVSNVSGSSLQLRNCGYIRKDMELF